MKYAANAENRHFYDFVFYETDKKNMYIYCPNCGQELQTEITDQHSVSWIKEFYIPCECFAYRGKSPKYKQSRYEHRNLNRVVSVGEFENRGNGDAALCVYWHKAEFTSSNYDAFGYAFKRYPIYSENKVIEIVYKNDGTVSMKTSLYIPMMSTSVSSGGWRDVKRWRYSVFNFGIIEESLEELRGTCLERFIPDIPRFVEALSDKFNVECAWEEPIAAFLIQMHTSYAVRKLWKAGYMRIVVNKIFEYMSPKNYSLYYLWGNAFVQSGLTVNYRGKTLEKILKVEPSKIDLISNRQNLCVTELRAAQKVVKSGVEINKPNIAIAMSARYDDIAEFFNTINPNKMFKFIRHEAHKHNDNYNIVVADYFDYLKAVKRIGTAFTDDVVFPSKFKEAHDRATGTLKALTEEINSKAFCSAISIYKPALYSNGIYSISVIGSINQLKSEAEKMHNCSAGYVDRIIRGDSVIFKIRQLAHPKTAFCMLEYSPKNKQIVQNRGVRNSAVPSDVQEFASLWLKNVIIPLEKRICK